MATFLYHELDGSVMRYARIAPNGNINFYPVFLNYMLRKHGAKCVYCTRKVHRGGMSIDHVFPKALGGCHSPDNLTLSCSYCNGAKGIKTPEEFRSWLVEKNRMYSWGV